MRLTLGPDSYVVLDLDDTLYPEIDFVRSGFRAVADSLAPLIGSDPFAAMWQRYNEGGDAFGWVVDTHGTDLPDVSVASMLHCYREHHPDLSPAPGVCGFLRAARARG